MPLPATLSSRSRERQQVVRPPAPALSSRSRERQQVDFPHPHPCQSVADTPHPFLK